MSMKHINGPLSQSSLTKVQPGDIQPNATDLRLGKVLAIDHNSIFEISNDHKVHRGSTPLWPDEDGYYTMGPGSYEVIMENKITVGDHEAGWVITRSTLNRNGCFLTSGLYDSGYEGVMAGVLHVTVGTARIKKGTRIGQYLNFSAEMLSKYDGDYGTGKAHDAKYEEQ